MRYLTNLTWFWVCAIILVAIIGLVSGWRISLGSILGVSIYFIYLCLARSASNVISKLGRKPSLPKRKPVPTSLLDIATTYRLGPMEVILGFARKRPIRIDFGKHHTLIAGVTGFGKTYMLISILVQLFSRGTRFTDHCDVYLFDYKADGEDYLHLWKPMLKGYYSIAENSSDEAIKAIEELANRIHDKPDKRILVIIDEVASITAEGKAAANHALMLLASKLRSRGTMIVATQHPRYDIIPRAVTINMSRKIAVHLDDEEQAKLVFRSNIPSEFMPFEQGEFTIKEPGETGLKMGMGIKPIVPGDIHEAIKIALPMDHGDPRVKFLMDTIGGLAPGDSVLGINKRVDEARLIGVELKQKEVSDHYKAFAEAGVLARERKGQPYSLVIDYPSAIKKFEESLNGRSK